MAEVGGLQLDFLQQVVNVNWSGGLAVDFGDFDEDAPKPGHDDTTA